MYMNEVCGEFSKGLGGLGDTNGDWGGETDNPAILVGGGSNSTNVNFGQPSYWDQITGGILKSVVDTAGKVAIISATPNNTAITNAGIFRNTGIPMNMGLPSINPLSGGGISLPMILLIGGGLFLLTRR